MSAEEWSDIENAPRDGRELYARRLIGYGLTREGWVYFDDRRDEFVWCKSGRTADVTQYRAAKT